MPRRKRRTGRVKSALVTKHLRGIKRALLEGEKGPVFLEYLRQTDDRRGLYALYDKKGRLHYAGKASDLPQRMNQHLKDKHAESWDQMTLFFLSKSANVAELEGLLIAAANPPGNKQQPRIGADMRKELFQFLKQDSISQLNKAIYPHKKTGEDRLSGRITAKKLQSVTQKRLASALGITQARISQLVKHDRKGMSEVRRYIRESGRRDSVLLMLQKVMLD